MSETRRLLKNTGIIAVGGMATKLVQFLLLPLYTTVLTTAEYGTVDYVNTIALFLVPAVSLLMDEALFRFLIDCCDDKDRKRVVTSSCVVLGSGCCAFAVLMLAVWFAFQPGNLAWVVALVVSQCLLTMSSAVMRGFGDTVSFTVMNLLAGIATIVMNILFIAVFHWGVVGMLSAAVIAQACAALIFMARKKIWRYICLNAFDSGEAKDMVRYSLPLIPNKVSWTIMNMLDRLIIMNTIGSAASGVYAVSYKFPSVMDQIYGFFYQSWKESSARALCEDDADAFYNSVYRALRRFMMSVVLGMTALMPLVYGILIKGSFDEGILYVPILLLATYFSNMSGFYGGVFTAHKDTGIMGTTTVVSAMLCIVLCLVLIPLFGLYGASVATIAATFTVNEYRRIKVAKYVRLHGDKRELILTVLAVAVTFALFYVHAYTDNLFALVGCLCVAVSFFVGMNLSLIKKAVGFVVARRG